jgi:hypothetical protein
VSIIYEPTFSYGKVPYFINDIYMIEGY